MICEEPFGSNYCVWCDVSITFFELIDICFFGKPKKRPRTLAFIRFLHCSVFKGHRRLATACISYQTQMSLSRTFFGRIEQFFISSSKDISRLSRSSLQCPVPDGLISISQNNVSVNYFLQKYILFHKRRENARIFAFSLL